MAPTFCFEWNKEVLDLPHTDSSTPVNQQGGTVCMLACHHTSLCNHASHLSPVAFLPQQPWQLLQVIQTPQRQIPWCRWWTWNEEYWCRSRCHTLRTFSSPIHGWSVCVALPASATVERKTCMICFCLGTFCESQMCFILLHCYWRAFKTVPILFSPLSYSQYKCQAPTFQMWRY